MARLLTKTADMEIHLHGGSGAGERNCRKFQKGVQELDYSLQ